MSSICQRAHKYIIHCKCYIILHLYQYLFISVYLFGRNLFAFSICKDLPMYTIKNFDFLDISPHVFLSLVFRNLITMYLRVDFFDFFLFGVLLAF